MGKRRILVVADHETVAAVLRDRPDGFRRTDRRETMGLVMGLKPGLFGVNGDPRSASAAWSWGTSTRAA